VTLHSSTVELRSYTEYVNVSVGEDVSMYVASVALYDHGTAIRLQRAVQQSIVNRTLAHLTHCQRRPVRTQSEIVRQVVGWHIHNNSLFNITVLQANTCEHAWLITRGQTKLAKAASNASNVPILCNGQNFPPTPPPCSRGIGTPSNNVPLIPKSFHPKHDLDPFSRFCTA